MAAKREVNKTSKSDFAVVEVTVKVSKKICFDEPLTEAQMRKAIKNEEWADVLDEEELELVSIGKIEMGEE